MAKANLTQSVSAWLGRINSTDVPPTSVVAYNVGLLETKKGYSAYFIGADQYDETNGARLA